MSFFFFFSPISDMPFLCKRQQARPGLRHFVKVFTLLARPFPEKFLLKKTGRGAENQRCIRCRDKFQCALSGGQSLLLPSLSCPRCRGRPGTLSLPRVGKTVTRVHFSFHIAGRKRNRLSQFGEADFGGASRWFLLSAAH